MKDVKSTNFYETKCIVIVGWWMIVVCRILSLFCTCSASAHISTSQKVEASFWDNTFSLWEKLQNVFIQNHFTKILVQSRVQNSSGSAFEQSSGLIGFLFFRKLWVRVYRVWDSKFGFSGLSGLNKNLKIYRLKGVRWQPVKMILYKNTSLFWPNLLILDINFIILCQL